MYVTHAGKNESECAQANYKLQAKQWKKNVHVGITYIVHMYIGEVFIKPSSSHPNAPNSN